MSTVAFVRPLFGQNSKTAANEQVRQESLAISQGLKRQDPGLLDELIVRYQHRLLRYLLYLTSNREMAEDLFQEVWMRVMVRGAQFNGNARFDTWLFTIARNLVIDQRRKRTMSSLDELVEGNGDDDRPMSFESVRPVFQSRGPRTDCSRVARNGHALPRGAGSPIPRGIVPGRDRQGDARSAFDREIKTLSWIGRDQA
jgi:RNA polymerase sigma factor (sigma-70 family)